MAAATPADSPAIMYCGSMRNELNATWLAEIQTGTIRLAHSPRRGRSDRYGIEYGSTGTER